MLQQGFRTFLSTTATVEGWSADGSECNLVRARLLVFQGCAGLQ